MKNPIAAPSGELIQCIQLLGIPWHNQRVKQRFAGCLAGFEGPRGIAGKMIFEEQYR
jgi:predicted naringenin-chalcone synthase